MSGVAVCGENPLRIPCGCGDPIVEWEQVYRCTDCDVPFHKGCAREHFRKSIEQAQARPSTPESVSAPRIASREARYEAVMKYHQRIVETGSPEVATPEASR